jgi:hypothetical protein
MTSPVAVLQVWYSLFPEASISIGLVLHLRYVRQCPLPLARSANENPARRPTRGGRTQKFVVLQCGRGTDLRRPGVFAEI